MSEDDIHPALRETASDIVGSWGRGIADFVLPVFGSSLLNAVVGEVTTGRMDRFARFMTKLDRAVRRLEEQGAIYPPLSGAKLRLFEDGARVAVRAQSDERIDQLAHLLADGLTGSDIVASDNHRLLEVIEQLSDDEVVYLFSFSRLGQSPEWQVQHRALIDPFEEARTYNEYREEHPEAPAEPPEAAAARYLENRRVQVMYDLREKEAVLTWPRPARAGPPNTGGGCSRDDPLSSRSAQRAWRSRAFPPGVDLRRATLGTRRAPAADAEKPRAI